jgi:drug/metabolite transporter (DMT)-like permease
MAAVFAIALAFSSSICWGVSDFLGGVQARRVPLIGLMLFSQGAALVTLLAVLVVGDIGAPPLVKLLPAAAAGLGGAIALTAFYRALAIGTMSIVAPISATGVVLPVLAGVASGNRPGALQAVGILAAVVGVVLAARERTGVSPPGVARASVGLALLAALGFGGFLLGMRTSAQANVVWALAAARVVSVLALLAVAAVRRQRVLPERRSISTLAAVLAIGGLDLLANLLYAVASRHGELALVAVVASLYPVATVLLARAVLRERVRRAQELGIVTAIAGVILIAAG